MSSIFNNNIKNQSQNLNDYININDDGSLSFGVINCDTLNAQNENIQNNETIEGWSRATGEITAFYSTTPISMSDLKSVNDTQTTNISTLQGQMSTANTNITNLTSSLSTTNTNVANNTSAISSLNTSVSGIETDITSLETKTQNQSSLGINYTAFVGNVKSNSLLSDNLELGGVTSGNMGSLTILDSNGASAIELQGEGDGKDIRIQCEGAISAKGYLTNPITTSQMNALDPDSGFIVYNSTDNHMYVANGASFIKQAPQSGVTDLQDEVDTLQTDITNLETKTQSLSDNGTTLTITHPISASSNLVVGGNLVVNGGTITANSVLTDYQYVRIVQNSADGVHAALSITQGGTASGPILSVVDSDNNEYFNINQNCDLDINNKFKVTNSTGALVSSSTGTFTDLVTTGTNSVASVNSALNTLSTGKFDKPTGTTSQYLRGDGTLATYTATGSMASLDVQNNKTIYMSASGNDSNSGYSEQNAVLSLSQACINASNSGVQVAIFPATYTLASNVTLNNLNCSYTSCNAESGGICNISSGSYSVTISNSSSSLRFYGLSFSCPVIVSASGTVYFERCKFNTSLSLTGSGYVSFVNCDLQGASNANTVSITGSGVKFIGSNCYVGVLTVNSATAVVAINNANNCLPITLQAGYLAIGGNTPIYSATTTSNAITATGASSILVLDDVTLLTPIGTSGRMSIGSGVTYSIRKLFYDKTNTSNSGTRSTQNLCTDGIDVNTLTAGSVSASTLTSSGDTNINGILYANGSTVCTGSLATSATQVGGVLTCLDKIRFNDLVTANAGSTMDMSTRTDSIILPQGDTSQRPTGAEGMIRYNTETDAFEGYNGSWGSLGGSFNPTISSPSLYQTLWYDGSVWKNGIPIAPPTISLNASTKAVSVTSSYATSSPFWLNGTASYHYQASTSSGFGSIAFEATTSSTSWSPGFTGGVLYYVRVQQAMVYGGSTYNYSAYCSTQSFTPIGDAIAAALSTSLAAYNAASVGAPVEITLSEYNNLPNTVSGTSYAGIVNNSGLWSSPGSYAIYTQSAGTIYMNYDPTQSVFPKFGSGTQYCIAFKCVSNGVGGSSTFLYASNSDSSTGDALSLCNASVLSGTSNGSVHYYCIKQPSTNVGSHYPFFWNSGNLNLGFIDLSGTYGNNGGGTESQASGSISAGISLNSYSNNTTTRVPGITFMTTNSIQWS